MPGKVDKAESLRRVQKVADWLLDGLLHFKICENANNEWGISQSQTYRYLKKAYQKLEKERNPADGHRRYAIRFSLLNRALAVGDGALALRILQDLDELEGYYKSRHLDERPVTVDFKFNVVKK